MQLDLGKKRVRRKYGGSEIKEINTANLKFNFKLTVLIVAMSEITLC